MNSSGGLIRNIVFGIAGGFIGELLFELIGISASGYIGTILVSVLGACIVIFFVNKLIKHV